MKYLVLKLAEKKKYLILMQTSCFHHEPFKTFPSPSHNVRIGQNTIKIFTKAFQMPNEKKTGDDLFALPMHPATLLASGLVSPFLSSLYCSSHLQSWFFTFKMHMSIFRGQSQGPWHSRSNWHQSHSVTALQWFTRVVPLACSAFSQAQHNLYDHKTINNNNKSALCTF